MCLGLGCSSFASDTSRRGAARRDSRADGFPGIVPIRDSKNLAGPRLVFVSSAWTPFLRTMKTGVFPSP
ncbi:DUF397 domain-containing protein [Streptomyces graminilatus]|uniref:DUF397 domain-containing protein n=1 Tax=Streptomyces graminilatus TaxID=1464070 RepID=UPI0024103736|nr:DUF397 domain-containing protein [Streptomyces graminilatus]